MDDVVQTATRPEQSRRSEGLPLGQETIVGSPNSASNVTGMRYIVFSLAILIAACAHAQPDRILERAASLPPGQTEPLERWLAANPGASDLRASVLGEICESASRAGRYRDAANACAEKAKSLGTGASPGLLRSVAFWRALASQPPVRVVGRIEEPLSYGWAGIPEVRVDIAGTIATWAVDTGAEVSVIRASDAARFGVRWLDRELGITGSTAGVAVGGLGMIDRMRIGAAEIANVPVMVLPDENLTFEGRAIPPILGMPVFYQFGSLAFVERGAHLRAGPSVGDIGGGRAITWNPSGIAIELQFHGGSLRVHLDTGANST
ncbi:MAG: clan AA aspartic protease, partial [Alphaproteobacteria bacterium]|nr:clan AA aspartic protease [Alphaproteobacteria bacterium]